MSRAQRKRWVLLVLILVTVAAGLTAKALKPRFPVAGDMAGDALWATMVFFILGALRPRAPIAGRAAAALAIAFAVEFSQIYHAPWIDQVRATWLGAMVLGSSFDWRDLFCYAGGVIVGAVVERWATRK